MLLIATPRLTTSMDSPKLSSTNLETSFFTFWEVSEADWQGLLSKPEIPKINLNLSLSTSNNLLFWEHKYADNACSK